MNFRAKLTKGGSMFISSTEWYSTQQRISKCEKEIRQLREQTERNIYNMAKKILENPSQVVEEIKAKESIDEFIEDFMRS